MCFQASCGDTSCFKFWRVSGGFLQVFLGFRRVSKSFRKGFLTFCDFEATENLCYRGGPLKTVRNFRLAHVTNAFLCFLGQARRAQIQCHLP